MTAFPTTFRARLCLAILTSLLFFCAGTAKAADWREATTRHFSVIGTAPAADLRSAAERLELSRSSLNALLPWLDAGDSRKLQVVLFGSTAEYRSFKPLASGGDVDDAVAGYFIPGDVRYVITASAESGAELPAILSHEYFHYALKSKFPNTIFPAWLEEGLAEYFATLTVGADGNVTIGGDRRTRLAPLRQHPFIGSARFFAKPAEAERELFYSQAWLTASYLFDRTFARAKLQNLAFLLAAGEDTDGALRKSFGFGREELVAALTDHLSKSRIPVNLTTTPVSEPVSVKSVPTPTTDSVLGELLIGLNRLEDAKAYLRRAIAADRTLPAAHTALGVALARQASYKEAEQELRTAAKLGADDHATNFFLAYAICGGGQTIDTLEKKESAEVRSALERTVTLQPDHVEALQLLAVVYLSEGEKLREAESLLRNAIALRPEDRTRSILATALIRQEKYGEAAAIASTLTSSTDPRISSDATEILKAVAEYNSTVVDMTLKHNGSLPWDRPIIFLKRSWLTAADLERVDAELKTHNLNVLLGPTPPEEKRAVGTISRIACGGGRIVYTADVGGERLTLTSADFQHVLLNVVREGSHSYRLDCGVDISNEPVVLSYRETAGAGLTLTGIAFVPANFELQDAAEVASHRTVVVNEDMLRRGPGGSVIHPPDLTTEQRLAAVASDLRQPVDGEKRISGTITRIDCQRASYAVTVLAGGSELQLRSPVAGSVMVQWLTSENTQAPLVCGAETRVENVLVTYKGDELRAIEFLPAGFTLPNGSR
ncbi:MAG TPA: tetratricopeptide repeat protein [Pyrinomonadaceae bacterium]|nr:tetratricopeptide repeat protein [Pyrinomonadaceae bacterium]